MMETAVMQQRRRRPARLAGWLISLIALVLVVYFGFTSAAILHDASLPQLHPADVIVVFGAAEYDGHPSPVLRARLDHAFDLYKQGLAPIVIVTGGAGGDANYTEGGVGHDYLMQRGIPENNVIAETLGTDTAQSAARVAGIMRENHMRTCIAVSDEYHVFRVRKMLEREGIKVYLAPRPDSRPHFLPWRIVGVLREATSYLLWQLYIT